MFSLGFPTKEYLIENDSLGKNLPLVKFSNPFIVATRVTRVFYTGPITGRCDGLVAPSGGT